LSERSFQFFLQFHRGIPRQGPGSTESTTKAFRRIESLLPPEPAILDVGCGSGAPTMTLAELTCGTIVAVDIDPYFIDELRQKIAERGLGGRVTAQVADARALEFPPESFDLIWSEGALGIIGFEQALRSLRPLLRSQGVLAATESAWLRPVDEVSDEVRQFWADCYPAIASIDEKLEQACQAGYTPLGHFTLPDEDWAAYVDPLEWHMNEVLAAHPGDPDAEEATRAERREFEMFRNHLHDFGYVFFLLQRS
jgi:SAM-dependent methyltransferase